METFGDKKKQLSSNKYCCEICDYNTCRKSNIDKHFLSVKHKNMAVGDNGDKKKQISSKKKQEFDDKNVCENCNKQYISRNGLWKHKKICKEDISNIVVVKENTNDKDELILHLLTFQTPILYSENYIKILLLYKYQMEQLIKENQELKNEIDNLKKELHKYSHSQKEYYENNKNELIKKSNERLKKIAEENPDKIKQYRRNAYLKQKEKKKQKELENKNNEII